MPSLPAAVKWRNFFLTLEIFSSKIDMVKGISAGYESLGLLVRLAFGLGGKNLDFRASAFSEEVIAMPEAVTRLGMVWGVGGRWLSSSDREGRGQ